MLRGGSFGLLNVAVLTQKHVTNSTKTQTLKIKKKESDGEEASLLSFDSFLL